MTKIKECIEYYNFKNDISLYTVESLKKTLKKYNGKIGYGNKKILFERVKKCLNDYTKLKYQDINSIIKIQSLFRKAYIKYQINLCGPGFYNRKNITNDTDFLTGQSFNEIPFHYFFSYRDNDSFIYFFDIRSFKKLLNHSSINPYNRNPIPKNIIRNMRKKINFLKNNKISTVIEDDPIPDKNSPEGVKRTINDVFIELSSHGFNIQQEWFTNLNTYKYKILYRNLEDIWNYRTDLPISTKKRIVPPNGILFTVKPNSLLSVDDKFTLIKLIINEVYKLIMNGENIEDRKIGMMYFIIALAEVNTLCLTANPWVSFLIPP